MEGELLGMIIAEALSIIFLFEAEVNDLPHMLERGIDRLALGVTARKERALHDIIPALIPLD